MLPLLDSIRRDRVLVADGAMGTMLMKYGVAIHECPEAINLSRRDILESIARQYLEAGAEIIQTNTFGASPIKLARRGLDGKTQEINQEAVHAVQRVAGGKAYISGSVGPSGGILVPYGDITLEQLQDSFRRQITALVEAGVDCLCIETMIDVNEAIAGIRAAREVSRLIPIMATMTFNNTPRGFFTVMGDSIARAVEELPAAGADIIGSNCGNGIEMMVAIAAEFTRLTDRPIIIQSNAGLPELVNDQLIYAESPEFMAEKTADLLKVGVAVIGGCCGTTPEHIRTIHRVVTEYRRRTRPT